MTPAPVFIVGSPRSGTTLLRMILDSHSNIAIAPESSFLFRISKVLWIYGDIGKRQNAETLARDILRIRRVKDWMPEQIKADDIVNTLNGRITLGAIINSIYTHYAKNKGKSRWGDKTPKNLFAIPEILKMYPDARIIVLVRDGRDVALSLKKADFGRVNIIYGAYEWKKYSRKLLEYETKYPTNILKIHYEDLVAQPEPSIKTVFTFIGEPYEKNLLVKYLDHKDDIKHTKSSLFNKPINKNNRYKWKTEMPVVQQKRFEAIARKELCLFGYEVRYSRKACFFQGMIVFFTFFKRLLNAEYNKNYFDFAKLFIRRLWNMH